MQLRWIADIIILGWAGVGVLGWRVRATTDVQVGAVWQR